VMQSLGSSGTVRGVIGWTLYVIPDTCLGDCNMLPIGRISRLRCFRTYSADRLNPHIGLVLACVMC
jgi:hypothetical protein